MFVISTLIVVVAVLLLIIGLRAPAAVISEGRGKGEPVFRYMQRNAKDYRGYRAVTREKVDMSHPISDTVEILWADGSTSTFTGDGYLQHKLPLTKTHTNYVANLAKQVAGH